MRIQHWLVRIWSIAVAATWTFPAVAQVPAPLTAMSPAPVYGNPAVPGGVQGYGSIAPQSVPPGYNPWPRISPFEHEYVQTANRDGLWQTVYKSGGRKYWATADALLHNVRRPNRTLVGSEGSIEPDIEIVDPVTGTITTLSLPVGFGVTTVGGAPDDEIVGTLDIDTEIIGEERVMSRSLGTKLSWGYEEVDGRKLFMEGWWNSESTFRFKRGQGEFEGPAQTARVTAILPLFDGEQINGIPFSQKFEIRTDTESGGASINFASTAIWESRGGSFQIQPMWGIQYTHLREHFSFYGADSGQQIEYLEDGAPDITTAVPLVDRYRAYLNARVRSQLAGPVVGLLYQLGGDSLTFRGSTKFGLLANHNRMRLNGQGIGNPYATGYNQNIAFEEYQDHTNVSPMLEQSINAEMPIFSYVPVLRQMPLLEGAKLRVGYSIQAFWAVTRPGDSIAWQGQPLSPFIDVDRTKWYIHGWNIGIDWRY